MEISGYGFDALAITAKQPCNAIPALQEGQCSAETYSTMVPQHGTWRRRRCVLESSIPSWPSPVPLEVPPQRAESFKAPQLVQSQPPVASAHPAFALAWHSQVDTIRLRGTISPCEAVGCLNNASSKTHDLNMKRSKLDNQQPKIYPRSKLLLIQIHVNKPSQHGRCSMAVLSTPRTILDLGLSWQDGHQSMNIS